MAKDWEYKADNAKNKEMLKSFENYSRQDLIDCILDLKKQLKVFESESKTKDAQNEASIVFNKSWSVSTKIVYILTKESKPLLASELFVHLTKLDTSFTDFTLPKTVLSNYLSRSVKTGRIIKIKNAGFRAHYFGLPEWLDKNGVLNTLYRSTIQKF